MTVKCHLLVFLYATFVTWCFYQIRENAEWHFSIMSLNSWCFYMQLLQPDVSIRLEKMLSDITEKCQSAASVSICRFSNLIFPYAVSVTSCFYQVREADEWHNWKVYLSSCSNLILELFSGCRNVEIWLKQRIKLIYSLILRFTQITTYLSFFRLKISTI